MLGTVSPGPDSHGLIRTVPLELGEKVRVGGGPWPGPRAVFLKGGQPNPGDAEVPRLERVWVRLITADSNELLALPEVRTNQSLTQEPLISSNEADL
jgi:hypothetical protein